MQYAQGNAGANEGQQATSSKGSSNTPPSTSKINKTLTYEEKANNDSDSASDSDEDDGPAKKKSKTAPPTDVLGSRKSAKKASKHAEKDSPQGIYVYENRLCVVEEWGVGHGVGTEHKCETAL